MALHVETFRHLVETCSALESLTLFGWRLHFNRPGRPDDLTPWSVPKHVVQTLKKLSVGNSGPHRHSHRPDLDLPRINELWLSSGQLHALERLELHRLRLSENFSSVLLELSSLRILDLGFSCLEDPVECF